MVIPLVIAPMEVKFGMEEGTFGSCYLLTYSHVPSQKAQSAANCDV